MYDMNTIIDSHDLLFITFDTLRYDVACEQLALGRTPVLATYLPNQRWEQRHTPASFTYAAHQAFFAGFLPTPVTPGAHSRLFAAHFAGSTTTTAQTFTFEQDNIVTALAVRGYHTVCIGGVGFFNPAAAIGRVLPGLFAEQHWSVATSVTAPDSATHQIEQACAIIERHPPAQRLFLFINIAAIHQPNYFYLPDVQNQQDNRASHAAALAYVDSCLPPLFAALQARGACFCILCSDHGTTYGEDGYHGHRLAHPVVWNVPYAEFVLPAAN